MADFDDGLLEQGWVLNKRTYKTRLDIKPDDINLKIVRDYAEKKKPDKRFVILTLGQNIIHRLAWEDDENICFYFNKDNQKKIMICKCDSDSSYKLRKEAKKNHYILKVTWAGELILPESNVSRINYKIFKESQILLTLPV